MQATKNLLIFLISFFVPIIVFGQKKELARQADSLRLIEHYDSEYKLRQTIGDETGFDFILCKINNLIEEEDQEAKILLDNLNPVTPEQEYLKSKALALYYRYADEPSKAIAVIKATKIKEYSLESATNHLNLSRYYSDLGEDLEVLKHLEKSYEIFEKIGQANFYTNGIVLSDLAFFYAKVGDESKNIEYSKRALRLYLENYPDSFRLLSTFFNNLIMYLIDYGDKKEVAEYFTAYENFMTNSHPKINGNIDEDGEGVSGKALYLLSRVRVFSFMQDTKNAPKALDELERFFQNPNPWFAKGQYYLSAAIELVHYMYRNSKDYPNALKYAELLTKYENEPYNQMKKYASIALTHYYSKQPQPGLNAINKSLAAINLPKGNASLQTIMAAKAEMLASLGRYKEAESVLKEIFENILDSNSYHQTINIDDFPTLVNSTSLNLFIHSGWVYQTKYLEGGKNPNDYSTSRNLMKTAASIFEKYYQKGFYNNGLGKRLNEIKDGLYFESDNLSQKELAEDLNRLEKISNAHLWGKFSSKYMENLNLPSNVIQRKNELNLKRTLLSKNHEMEGENIKEIRAIEEELSDIEQELKIKYPEYSFISSSDFDIKILQKKLHPNQAVLKFSVGVKNIYAHYITSENIVLKKLGDATVLEDLVNQYLGSIKSLNYDFQKLQTSLSSQLIKPFNLDDRKKTIIVPEGFISYIPFETLLPAPTITSYAFNLKSLTQEIPGSKKYAYNLAGFVPNYSDHPNTNPLKYSIKELEHIKRLIKKDKIFKNMAAKKNTFLKSLGKFKIIHLAMHSEMDENNYEESSLIFSNMEKLFFWELYALNIPSEMIVLSACNTGLGKYINGEGVMSLARALNYAGVKSTVSCLWEVSDKESSELMAIFYEYLIEGKPKDEALSLAKIKFRELYPMKAHPYYWAGFVLTGDSDPVDLSSSLSSELWEVALISLLILAVIIAYKRRLFKI